MDNVDSLDMSGNLTVTAICAYWKSCPGDDTPFVVSLFREGFPLDFGMWLGDICLFIHKNISEVKQRCWWEGLACSWHQFTPKVFSRVDVRFLSRPHVLPHQHWYTIIGFYALHIFLEQIWSPLFPEKGNVSCHRFKPIVYFKSWWDWGMVTYLCDIQVFKYLWSCGVSAA